MIVSAVLFLGISTAVLVKSERDITEEFLNVLGESVTDYAMEFAGNLTLSDSDVAALKAMSFEEAAKSDINLQFTASVNAEEYRQKLRFIYLYVPLEEEEIKYRVNIDNQSYYHAKPGTELDVMYLLDIVVRKDGQVEERLEDGSYYEDYRRYSILGVQSRAILEAREAAYAIIKDEWGEVLVGYAPVYTTEGSFIGMVGVDMDIDTMLPYKEMIISHIVALYLTTSLALLGLFLFIYIRYMRIRREQLYVDPLTNAYNRRYFNEMFRKNLQIKRNIHRFLVILMIDIDHFKAVNDTYGHEKGDECLKAISETIAKVLHAPPNVLVRYGGEEFLAAMTVDNRKQAEEIIADILRNVREMDLFADHRRVTISGGAVILPYGDVEKSNIQFLVKIADDNLYYAKNNGRNCSKVTDFTTMPR
ncbi:MAG: GGDEF domain-containing protein [Clostridiaceae bacterium]|nr:GGDEF domain-containing protein [Clostridiaceae bacterium]